MKPVQKKTQALAIFLAVLVLAAAAHAQSASKGRAWVGTWAASQQTPEPRNTLDDMRDLTLRQVFHLSVGGSTLRVHLSNVFGTQPLRFTAVHIAKPVSISSAQIDPASDRALRFSGSPDVIVPAGAEYISDPIEYPVAALSSVDITFYIEDAPTGETGHPGSRATSYYVHRNLVDAPDLPDAKRIEHWYQISGIDVLAGKSAGAIVALGDSITDGHGATTNGNDRWTDVLAERLQASPKLRNLSVLNHGIGGNHLLIDGLGPNALSRFDRDVLVQPGVRYAIVFEGVNDLGGLTREGEVSPEAHAALVHRIIGSYEQMIARAHTRGIRIFGATITPFVGSQYYHPPPSTDADRQKINDWIREPGHFDAVIDFDKVIRDPQHPNMMLPEYDLGDHLHPSVKGYRAMGEAVPLSLFSH